MQKDAEDIRREIRNYVPHVCFSEDMFEHIRKIWGKHLIIDGQYATSKKGLECLRIALKGCIKQLHKGCLSDD